jgi:hypothetical protein
MPFCTIVEFEWTTGFGREQLEDAMDSVASPAGPPEGRLTRIVGMDDNGAHVVEVWRSGQDAKRFAEQSGPALSESRLPPPSRVIGFEVTDLETQ